MPQCLFSSSWEDQARTLHRWQTFWNLWTQLPAQGITKSLSKTRLLCYRPNCCKSCLPVIGRQHNLNGSYHNLEPLHRCHRTSCRCGFASTPHLFKSCLEPRKQMRVARLQLCSHQCRNVTQSDSTTLGVCQDGWMNVTASHVQNQDNIAFLNDTSQR